MRVLELTGVVDNTELEYNGPFVENPEGPRIGGQYVVAALNETFPETGLSARERPALTVLLAHGGDQTLIQLRAEHVRTSAHTRIHDGLMPSSHRT